MTDRPKRAVKLDAVTTSTRREFLVATKWSFIAQGGGQVVLLVFGGVLAALVGPEAYGVVVMATVYVLLIELIQRQGIISALIQRRQITEEHVSSAFWLVLGTSIAMTVLSISLAGWWADINDVPLLGPIIISLSALLPLKALIVIQEAILRRQMDFKKVALRTTVAASVGGLAGIVAAVSSPSPWALVIQQLTSAGTSVVLLWWATPWRPRWSFSWSAMRDLLGFSFGSFISSLGVFGGKQADMLLIGLFLGPAATGIYAFGARLTDAALGISLRPMQGIALPELAPYQDRLTIFRSKLRRVYRTTAVVGLPALGILAGTAVPITVFVGPEWSAAATPLQLLSVAAAVAIVIGAGGTSLQAIGRPHLLAAYTWLTALTGAGAIITAAVALRDATVAVQLIGIALARLMSSVLIVLVAHLIIMRLVLGMTTASSLGPFGPAALSGAAGAIAGIAIQRIDSFQTLSVPLQFVASGTTAAFVGGLVLLAIDRSVRSMVFVCDRRWIHDDEHTH